MVYRIMLSVVMLSLLSPVAFAAEHSFGLGFHYFYTLDDISNDLEDDIGDSYHRDGLAMNVSYRLKPTAFIGIQAEVQAYPDGYYDAETAISPRLLVILGKGVYMGGGIAWNYLSWEDETEILHDKDGWSDPYFILRGGLEMDLFLPQIRFDINVNYELNEWNEVNDFDSDTLTFGAGLKIVL